MASIRRTLSPVPRPGTLITGEAVQVASPLSRSSSNNQNNLTHSGGVLPSSLGSLDYTLYKAQNLILGSFSSRSSRPFDRSKVKGTSWRRVILHFLACFMVGVFLGLTPFVSVNLSANITPNNRQQAFEFDLHQPVKGSESYGVEKSDISARDGLSSLTDTSEPHRVNFKLKDDIINNNHSVSYSLFDQDSNSSSFHKLVIVVTPTRARPLQTYYLTRLAHTLRLVPHPLLWIVVEMNSQSMQTAELLRSTGVMYRHLVCSSVRNITEVIHKKVLMRNVALSHIETHRLDGIVYFADDDGIYSSELFEHMRQISRFGTWTVAKLAENQKGNVLLQGPICNGTQVIGWHVADVSKRFRRFHAEMSGFAFNSTIIWDPKRWHRPTLEPIRQIVTVKEDSQASAFIEQIVEDESQMECFLANTTEIMTWHHTTDFNFYPGDWIMSYSLGSIFPLV